MAQKGSEMENKVVNPMLPPIPENKEIAAKASAALQPEEPTLQFFNKLYNDLPVVSSTLDLTYSVYNKFRSSNCISYHMLKTAEKTADAVKNSTNPIVNIFKSPLMQIDYLMCATLDFVEEKVPVVKLTPHEIYENTKWTIKYVCTGQCALNCVCKTGIYGLHQANNLKNLLLCKSFDDSPAKAIDYDGQARLRKLHEKRLALNVQKYQMARRS